MAKAIRDHLRLVENRFMTKQGKIARGKIILTTVGDLIAALVEEVAPYVKNEKESNVLVSYIFMDLCRVRPRCPRPGKTADLSSARCLP